MPSNTALKSLDLVNIDFDYQKNDLIAFLKTQEYFKDYDFTGSNMNVLIDLLTYNSQKMIFFYNMNFAESFIDTAQLRDSILSHSKALNYTPRSAKSAKARVSMTFRATSESAPYIIQKGQGFQTFVKNDSYMFTIPETIVVASVDNNFSFETDVYEGIYVKDPFIFLNTPDTQRFRLSNKNVDTSSMTVTVYEDGSLNGDKYFRATSLLDLDRTSKVYFLQASELGFYEIIFGDNITGRQPKVGSSIVIDYRITKGDIPNGALRFTRNFDPTGDESELLDEPEVLTIQQASGGAQPESNESIRYYAPRHFQQQERCVIPTDYEDALKEAFPEINAVSAYGGEDANPPQFGKIFIAVDIADVDGFPDSKKEEYYNFVRKRSALKPVFVNPQFTYFDVNTTVRYNVNLTTASPNTIKSLVTNQIFSYNLTNLNDFGVILRGSQLARMIDDADASIVSNVTNVRLYKKLNPILGKQSAFVLNFGVPLKNDSPAEALKYGVSDAHTISSDVFKYQGVNAILNDDNAGNVRLVQLQGDQSFTTLFNIGTVDYTTGQVIFSKLQVDLYNGPAFKIFATPADRDIAIPKSTVGAIETNTISVNVQTLSI